MFFTTFFFRVISQRTYEQLVPNRSQTFVFIPNAGKCETGTAWKVPKYGVFSGLNTRKYGPEKTPYLETFVAVRNTSFGTFLCNHLDVGRKLPYVGRPQNEYDV